MKSDSNKENFIWAAVVSVAFFAYCFSNLFVLTAPSDPLQYVRPALFPENGFAFFDRIILWCWIRICSFLPIAREYVGGVSTLLINSSILFSCFYWLARRVNLIASSIFGFTFILSPWSLSYATYTYPSSMMTLIFVLTLIFIDLSKEDRQPLIGGVGWTIALLSKIQAYSFGVFLLVDWILSRKRNLIKNKSFISFSCKVLFGIIIALSVVFLSISIVDGLDFWVDIFKRYFINGGGSVQYKGRGHGGLPPFDEYLHNPAFLISLIGALLATFCGKYKKVSRFGTLAIIQHLGLLFIYIVTQRGGPLISNYSYDAVVLGLVALAGSAGIYLNDALKNRIKRDYIMPTGLMIFTFSILLCFTYIPNVKIAKLLVLIITSMFLFLIHLNYKDEINLKMNKKKYIAIIFLIYSIIAIEFKSLEGITVAKSKMKFSEPYHQVAKSINDIKKKGSVFVNLMINRSTRQDGTTRLRQVYISFYNQKYEYESEIYWKKSNNIYKFILIDNFDINGDSNIVKGIYLFTRDYSQSCKFDYLNGFKNCKMIND